MKKIILIICLICFAQSANAEIDYIKIYADMDVPTHSYIHNIDPDQYFETKNFTWSPYPSFRLVSPLYFKSIAIEPGYYLLTPREYKGKWYILFKQAGFIRYIIPTYNRDIVPEFFYAHNLPKAKLTFGQKLNIGTLNFIGKYFPSARREPIPQTYLETTDLDNNYISIVLYWGNFRYYTILRSVRL